MTWGSPSQGSSSRMGSGPTISGSPGPSPPVLPSAELDAPAEPESSESRAAGEPGTPDSSPGTARAWPPAEAGAAESARLSSADRNVTATVGATRVPAGERSEPDSPGVTIRQFNCAATAVDR